MRDPFKLPPYSKLRGRCAEYGATYKVLGQVLHLGLNAISERFCNVTPFTLPEIYKLMDFLEIPDNQMHEFFPRDGGCGKKRAA